jgi:hypothetical protein
VNRSGIELYMNCPMMLLKNTDILKEQVNGSHCILHGINAKNGEHPFMTQLDCGAYIDVYYTSQIEYLEMQYENDEIRPSHFTIKPKDFFVFCNYQDSQKGKSTR